MAGLDKVAELEKAIDRFYERYSAQRIAVATLMVGVLCLAVSLAVYWGFGSGIYAALSGLLFGVIGINIAFLSIVPPANALTQSKRLICKAIREPSCIRSYDMHKVQLVDPKGKVHTLGARELKVWTSLVVPYLIESQARGVQPSRKKPQRKLTASERKYIEQRRKEVLAMEKKIEDERKNLENDRRELEIRSMDLKQAEELVIERLTGVEQAEAELEQLKIVAAERADVAATAYDAKAAAAQADELRAKELELTELKQQLAEDRRNFESQKAEMSKLQAAATRSPFGKIKEPTGAQSLEAREAALEARVRKLEEEAQALESRASYLTDSENSLIERLDALVEREAHIEQSEVDAGIRKD
ncbi:hypothetical protein SH580_13445 [Coraliomargarita algicola]|uniref:Uncharacterized protein n=1 Tax=Coraliomargarita algicola TaxID=3092156 RepID=A0ABZ0RH95_9BACT|nr:hypothetical protein [Coraliomargarita sp. J2-16]WPJ94438.1 hypothetical protein SH580_13445 [Coraliomargarita sp. J2-16]